MVKVCAVDCALCRFVLFVLKDLVKPLDSSAGTFEKSIGGSAPPLGL